MIQHPYKGKGPESFLKFDGKYDKDFLQSLFRSMLRIRLIEEKIADRYHEDEMKTPIHLVIGQEATSVGVCAALRKSDQVFGTHRSHGNYLAKNGDLKAMLAEMYCRITGCVGSRGGSMHLVDKDVGMMGTSAIVAGCIPIATGMALASKMKKIDQVTVGFFGDAATEEGATWEGINFAALKKLPIVYVCENNFFSVFTPIAKRQPPVDIYKKAESFGLKSCVVDGTNVLEVYEAASAAVERARSGGGATFIESRAYRWRGHGGAVDDSGKGYRDPEEVSQWQKYCPIESFFDYFKGKGIFDDPMREGFEKEIGIEIKEAFEFAIASPNPAEDDLYSYQYAD